MNIRTTIKCDCGRRIVDKRSLLMPDTIQMNYINAEIWCPGCGARISMQKLIIPTSEASLIV